MVTDALLNILVCPETKQPLKRAPAEVVSELNSKISAGQLKNRSGSAVSERLDGALIREDGKVAYPVRNDIPVMLVEESLAL